MQPNGQIPSGRIDISQAACIKGRPWGPNAAVPARVATSWPVQHAPRLHNVPDSTSPPLRQADWRLLAL
ncbi:hypothetical protein GCM10009776_26200 [Microbacterium deminutum]|uniref:Uncharacterized protein n=1 Tax=Microbacterium deminutum TaxID=344164 RepID=A0ABP5CGY9_9MICO